MDITVTTGTDYSGVNSLSDAVLQYMIVMPMQLYIGLVGCKMGLRSKIKKELRRFDDRVRETVRDIDDQVRGVASDADDWRRDNPVLSAMIPFTPENQALMAGGGALLGGGMALSGALGSGGAAGAGTAGAGAGAAAGTGAAATGGGMSLGTLGLGLGSIGASLYGANQAKKGVNAQIEAANYAAALEKESADKQLALQREIWEKQQADQAPWLKEGGWGISRLGDLMRNQTPAYNASSGFNATIPMGVGGVAIIGDGGTKKPTNNANGGQLNNPFDTYLASKGLAGGKFDTTNPAYQFQLKQGQQALDRSAAARGMGYSGAQMKAAQQFGQGLASQQYDKEYDRAKGEFGDYYNRLASLASGGQQTAQSLGGMGGNYSVAGSNTLGNLSNAQTNILGQQANARASGYAANANAFNQVLGNMIDIYGISKKYGQVIYGFSD